MAAAQSPLPAPQDHAAPQDLHPAMLRQTIESFSHIRDQDMRSLHALCDMALCCAIDVMKLVTPPHAQLGNDHEVPAERAEAKLRAAHLAVDRYSHFRASASSEPLTLISASAVAPQCGVLCTAQTAHPIRIAFNAIQNELRTGSTAPPSDTAHLVVDAATRLRPGMSSLLEGGLQRCASLDRPGSTTSERDKMEWGTASAAIRGALDEIRGCVSVDASHDGVQLGRAFSKLMGSPGHDVPRAKVQVLRGGILRGAVEAPAAAAAAAAATATATAALPPHVRVGLMGLLAFGNSETSAEGNSSTLLGLIEGLRRCSRQLSGDGGDDGDVMEKIAEDLRRFACAEGVTSGSSGGAPRAQPATASISGGEVLVTVEVPLAAAKRALLLAVMDDPEWEGFLTVKEAHLLDKSSLNIADALEFVQVDEGQQSPMRIAAAMRAIAAVRAKAAAGVGRLAGAGSHADGSMPAGATVPVTVQIAVADCPACTGQRSCGDNDTIALAQLVLQCDIAKVLSLSSTAMTACYDLSVALQQCRHLTQQTNANALQRESVINAVTVLTDTLVVLSSGIIAVFEHVRMLATLAAAAHLSDCAARVLLDPSVCNATETILPAHLHGPGAVYAHQSDVRGRASNLAQSTTFLDPDIGISDAATAVVAELSRSLRRFAFGVTHRHLRSQSSDFGQLLCDPHALAQRKDEVSASLRPAPSPLISRPGRQPSSARSVCSTVDQTSPQTRHSASTATPNDLVRGSVRTAFKKAVFESLSGVPTGALACLLSSTPIPTFIPETDAAASSKRPLEVWVRVVYAALASAALSIQYASAVTHYILSECITYQVTNRVSDIALLKFVQIPLEELKSVLDATALACILSAPPTAIEDQVRVADARGPVDEFDRPVAHAFVTKAMAVRAEVPGSLQRTKAEQFFTWWAPNMRNLAHRISMSADYRLHSEGSDMLTLYARMLTDSAAIIQIIYS